MKITPKEEVIQKFYRLAARFGPHLIAELESITEIEPCVPQEVISTAYEQVWKGIIYSTSDELSRRDAAIARHCSERREEAIATYKSLESALEAPSESCIKKGYLEAALKHPWAFVDYVKTIKELSGFEPDEEMVRKAYVAILEKGMESTFEARAEVRRKFLKYSGYIKELQEITGIKPVWSGEILTRVADGMCESATEALMIQLELGMDGLCDEYVKHKRL